MALAVKALFFDVFGTLVDWRSSIAREAGALLKPKGLSLDYPAFAGKKLISGGLLEDLPPKYPSRGVPRRAATAFCRGRRRSR